MSSASGPMRRGDDEPGLLLLGGLLLVSLVFHVVTVLTLPDTFKAPPKHRSVEMEFYEPPPPPPKVEEPPKPPDPPKELEKPKVKPVVVKVDKPPEPKKVEEPPPPNQEPPKEQTKPVPIVVGISMSSTTAAGGFAVQVGNTTYGKASDKIVDPKDVKAYSAPKYAPPGGADTEPVPLGEVKIPYPDEAKKNEIEGSVRLRVTVDATGVVESVSVISGPGYGLNEAARDALKRFKFKPATKGGEPVGYTLVYTYTFLLD